MLRPICQALRKEDQPVAAGAVCQRCVSAAAWYRRAHCVGRAFLGPEQSVAYLESILKVVEEDKQVYPRRGSCSSMGRQAVVLAKMEILRRKMQGGKLDECKVRKLPAIL